MIFEEYEKNIPPIPERWSRIIARASRPGREGEEEEEIIGTDQQRKILVYWTFVEIGNRSE